MMPVYICEDIPSHRKKINACVEKHISIQNYDMRIVLSCESPYKLLEKLQKEPATGVYFLDVDLKCDINGIQLAEKIREYDPRGFIVFITTHAEALKFTFKYKVEALDYIIKDDVDGVNPQICGCIDNINAKCTSEADNTKKFVFKVTENKVIYVDYKNILFFETSRATPRKVILNSLDGRYDFYARIDDIREKLDSSFLRCHRSYIVNTKNIKEVDFSKKEILMNNGSVCYVSARQSNKLKEFMMSKES